MTTIDLGHPGAGARVAQDFWTYAPAPESVKVHIADRYGHFIAGRFVEASQHFPTINPATEQTLCHVGQGTDQEIDAAVQAAREALPGWAALPGRERGKYLFRIARRLQERARELAVLETMDGGKPVKESRDVDIPLASAHFFYHAGWADKLAYAFAGRAPSCRSALQTEPEASGSPYRLGEPGHPSPVGVCGQIIPWNFPLLMAAWKIAPALACGNTVVLKPAETTPLTALRLAEICDEIDLPPGVVNIVTGDGRTGEALVGHPGIDKIAFTGSTEVGKRIARAVAEELRQTGKARRLTLELGGKSPNIIFEDASLDQAIEGIIQGIFFNQGHVCCAGSRLLVQESVLEQVIARLTLRMSTLRVGDPMDKNTDVGAINSRRQLDTIERYLDAGVDEGAELCVPGFNAHADAPRQRATGGFKRGYYCRPCFFRGVQPSQTIARGEIFGPVLSIMSFRTPEEAVSRANNTRYGLAAGVWTDKGSKIFDMASRLSAGVLWLNTYNQFDPTSPFGGFKESGFGREGGLHGLRGYVDLH
ncbi:MAG: aldehyde dehydrogenase family protein [Leptolyngbya sp. PLA3]|nr:MAG: aldehyde dehydrogenase family protein [Cyanobacteria bacterium CYA]MCE7969301.1 aldehyde dehydrogenase family protein [Leptolyngbya sp. PL-A3]